MGYIIDHTHFDTCGKHPQLCLKDYFSIYIEKGVDLAYREIKEYIHAHTSHPESGNRSHSVSIDYGKYDIIIYVRYTEKYQFTTDELCSLLHTINKSTNGGIGKCLSRKEEIKKCSADDPSWNNRFFDWFGRVGEYDMIYTKYKTPEDFGVACRLTIYPKSEYEIDDEDIDTDDEYDTDDDDEDIEDDEEYRSFQERIMVISDYLDDYFREEPEVYEYIEFSTGSADLYVRIIVLDGCPREITVDEIIDYLGKCANLTINIDVEETEPEFSITLPDGNKIECEDIREFYDRLEIYISKARSSEKRSFNISIDTE